VNLVSRLLLLLTFLSSLVFGANADAQGKPEKDKIRIGYAARAVTHSIPYLANEAGFFREEGVQVEVVRTAGAVSPMALLSGDTDFATMSAFLLIPVSVRNTEVIMLGGLTRYASMTLVSRPEIRNAKDLVGAVIGLQRPGDAYEKNARSALQYLKLNPDKDVKFLYLGTNEAMWIALDARRVAATMVSPPATLFARKAGMNFLVNLADLKVEYQGSTFATRRSFIKNIQFLHCAWFEPWCGASISLKPVVTRRTRFWQSFSAPVIPKRWRSRGLTVATYPPNPLSSKAQCRR
jgi:NitT/TauT family transport system substrate-binding protein